MVIGTPDECGEGMVALRGKKKGNVTEEEIVEWAKGKIAVHKYPRSVEFIDELPKSGTGKILWRELQEKEQEKIAKAKLPGDGNARMSGTSI